MLYGLYKPDIRALTFQLYIEQKRPNL